MIKHDKLCDENPENDVNDGTSTTCTTRSAVPFHVDNIRMAMVVLLNQLINLIQCIECASSFESTMQEDIIKLSIALRVVARLLRL
jgi:hypothetical protein